MRALFFHNPHDKTSKDVLAECQAYCPQLEVMDFMEAREQYHFMGTPAVRIGSEKEVLWEKSVQFTVAEIQENLSMARELKIILNPEIPTLNTPVDITVLAYDIDGQESSLPQDICLEIGDIDPVIVEDSEAEVTFTDPGVYTVRAKGSMSLGACLEVTIHD